MNTSIHSNPHTEEQDPTTDEIKQKRRTTSTLLIRGCQLGTLPMIDEEEEAEEELQKNKQRSHIKSSLYLYLHLLL